MRRIIEDDFLRHEDANLRLRRPFLIGCAVAGGRVVHGNAAQLRSKQDTSVSELNQ